MSVEEDQVTRQGSHRQDSNASYEKPGRVSKILSSSSNSGSAATSSSSDTSSASSTAGPIAAAAKRSGWMKAKAVVLEHVRKTSGSIEIKSKKERMVCIVVLFGVDVICSFVAFSVCLSQEIMKFPICFELLFGSVGQLLNYIGWVFYFIFKIVNCKEDGAARLAAKVPEAWKIFIMQALGFTCFFVGIFGAAGIDVEEPVEGVPLTNQTITNQTIDTIGWNEPQKYVLYSAGGIQLVAAVWAFILWGISYHRGEARNSLYAGAFLTSVAFGLDLFFAAAEMDFDMGLDIGLKFMWTGLNLLILCNHIRNLKILREKIRKYYFWKLNRKYEKRKQVEERNFEKRQHRSLAVLLASDDSDSDTKRCKTCCVKSCNACGGKEDKEDRRKELMKQDFLERLRMRKNRSGDQIDVDDGEEIMAEILVEAVLAVTNKQVPKPGNWGLIFNLALFDSLSVDQIVPEDKRKITSCQNCKCRKCRKKSDESSAETITDMEEYERQIEKLENRELQKRQSQPAKLDHAGSWTT